MKNINKLLIGILTITSGITPNYAGNDESLRKNAAKSSNKDPDNNTNVSPPGIRTYHSLSSSKDGIKRPLHQGHHAVIDKGIVQGGAGVWLTPHSDSSINSIKAKGGYGVKGGHGILIDGGSNIDGGCNNINLDDINVQGGSVVKTAAKFIEEAPVGGAGIFFTGGNEMTKIDIKNCTITGGQGNGYLVGKGMDIRGTTDLTLTHSSISSGNNGPAADAITMDAGSIEFINTQVKSDGAAGLVVNGPALVKVLTPSLIEGGLQSGVGICAKNQCQIDVSGKIYSGAYAVSFEGDNNTLTLKNGYQLKGKLKSHGKDNQLNLESQENDENRFYLSSLADNHEPLDPDSNNIEENHKQYPGFRLHKTGAGHWTLYGQNPKSNFEQIVVSEGSLTLSEESVDQTPRNVPSSGKPASGQPVQEQGIQSPIVGLNTDLYGKEIHIEPGAALGGCGSVHGQVSNSGTLLYGAAKKHVSPSHYLLIDGSYQGLEGSAVEMNVHLAGNESLINRVIINGDVSGKSEVKVIPHVDTKAPANDITLIKVTNNNALSADTFFLDAPVIIGGKEHFLKLKNNSWVLTNEAPGTQSYPDEEPQAALPAPGMAVKQEVKLDSPPAKPPRRKVKTADGVLAPSPLAPDPTAALQHPGAPATLIRDDAVAHSSSRAEMNLAETIKKDNANLVNDERLINTDSVLAESNLVNVDPALEIIAATDEFDNLADTNHPSLPAADSAPVALAKTHYTAQEIVYERAPHSPELMTLIEDVQPIPHQGILSDLTEGTPVASAAVVETDQDGETGAIGATAIDLQLEIQREADSTVSENASDILVLTDPDTAFAEEKTTEMIAGENTFDSRADIDAESTSADEFLSLATAGVAPSPIAAENDQSLPLESGIFAANLSAANAMFATRMHDRLGNPAYPEAGGYDHVPGSPALWLRAVGSRNKSAMSAGGALTQTHLQRVQLGGEIFHATRNGADGWHLGLMAGQGKSHSKTRSTSNGDDAKGGISGYAVGIYGTWHHDDEQRKGLYLDGSLNYNWFDNRVRAKSGTEQHYRSQGMIGTVETGYHQKWHQGEGYRAYIQPQAQLTWMGVRAEQAVINEQTLSSRGSDNLQTRLGARVYIEKRAKDRQSASQPYIETSWIHNTRPFGVECNGQVLSQQGGSHIAEFKIGHEGQISRDVALWGSLAHQIGGGDYANTAGTLGLTIRF